MNWRRPFQFRLSSLLWLMVAVAAGLGGYRAGMNEQLARQRQGTTYIKAYQVKDLVLGPGMTQPDYQTLIDMLVALSPKKWVMNGGPGTIAGFENAGIIVVSQDAPTHRQIQRKLSALRRLQSPWRSWLNALVAWINKDEPM
jgi:hypothetical protein